MKNSSTAILRAVICCVSFTLLLAAVSFFKNLFPPQYERYAYGVLGSIVALLVVFFFIKKSRQSFADNGLEWKVSSPVHFFAGLLAGFFLCALLILPVVYWNGLAIERITTGSLPSFLAWGMSLLLLSWMEEVAFRTYAFQNISKTAGPWSAQIIIAILFALYHVAGGQPLLNSLVGPGTWAFIFGWAVLRTGGIAMSTGIHFAANLFQAIISQKKQYAGLWYLKPTGELTAALQQRIDNSVLIVQLALLALGILLTWNVIKRKGAAMNPSH